MKSTRYLSSLKQISTLRTKKATTGERIFGALFPNRGTGWPGGWSQDRLEQVLHLKNWTYVAVNAIASKVASITCNLAYVTDQPGTNTTKACKREPGQFGGETMVSDGGHSFLTIGAYRSKALSVVKPHEELEPLENDHPLRRLVENPNPFDTHFDIQYEIQMFDELCGVSYEWLIPNQWGKPAERWCVPSHWVWPRTGGGRYVDTAHEHADELIQYYEIRPWGGMGSAGILKVPPTEIIMTRWKSPVNKIDGYSRLAAGAQWIDSEESISKSRWSQFQNMARPELHVELGVGYEDPDDPRIARLEAKFASKIQGEYNYGKPVITPPGTKLTPLSFSPTEMSYFQSEEQIRDMILSLFAVPKTAVGVSQDMTYGSLLASLAQFCSGCLNPRLAMRGQTLTKHLGSRYDERGKPWSMGSPTPGKASPEGNPKLYGGRGVTRKVRMWWDDCVPADPQQVNSDIQVDTSCYAITPNEVRALRGRKPYKHGGDDPLVQGAGGVMPLPLNSGEDMTELAQLVAEYTKTAQPQPEQPPGGAPGQEGAGGDNPLAALAGGGEQPGQEQGQEESSSQGNPLGQLADLGKGAAPPKEPNQKPQLSKTKSLVEKGPNDPSWNPDIRMNRGDWVDVQRDPHDHRFFDVVEVSNGHLVGSGFRSAAAAELWAVEQGLKVRQGRTKAQTKSITKLVPIEDVVSPEPEDIKDQSVVEEYRRLYVNNPIAMPAIKVVDMGGYYLVEEGTKRLMAARRAKLTRVKVEIVNKSQGQGRTKSKSAANWESLRDPVTVKLPDLRQGTPYSCGASCVMSICEYFGVGPQTEREYMEALHSDPAMGTNPNRVLEFLGEVGVQTDARNNLSLEEIQRAVSSGKPVLVLIQAWNEEDGVDAELILETRDDNGHYVIIVGIEEDRSRVYFEDPVLKGSRAYLSPDNLEKRWHDKDGQGNHYVKWGCICWKPKPAEEIKSLQKDWKVSVLLEDQSGDELGDVLGGILGGVTQESVLADPLDTEILDPLENQQNVEPTDDLPSSQETPVGNEEEKKYKFSSIQFDLSDAIPRPGQKNFMKKIESLRGMIDEGDVHPEEGLEDNPHVTVKYGLEIDDPAAVSQLVKGFGPVTVTLGKTSLFPDEGKGYEVVKIEVEGESLRRLNQLLKKHVPNQDNFPEYNPHVTLGYVKPGTGQFYVDNDAVNGVELTFSKLKFSDRNGESTDIDLVEEVRPDGHPTVE